MSGIATRQTIWIAIPVHNRKAQTRQCLLSLRRVRSPGHRVVVCDDGSQDGTAEMLHTEFPEVTVLTGDGNLWWAGATNRCVESILTRAAPADLVLTLNNDTIVPVDYLEHLLDAHRQHPQALIGSLVVTLDDPETIVSGETEIIWKTGLKRYKSRPGEHVPLTVDSIVKVPKLPGKGTLIPVAVFRQIGLYDEKNFPQYAADDDFSMRAAEAGYDLLLSYRARLHNDATSTGLGTSHGAPRLWPFIRSFWSIRSPNHLLTRTRFALRHCPRKYLLQFLLLDTARIILSFLKRRIRATGSA